MALAGIFFVAITQALAGSPDTGTNAVDSPCARAIAQGAVCEVANNRAIELMNARGLESGHRRVQRTDRRTDRLRRDAGPGSKSQEHRTVEGNHAGRAAVARQTFPGRVLVGPRPAGPHLRLHPQRHPKTNTNR